MINGDHPVETKKYALEMANFDFGVLNARNQFISQVINPMLDSVMPQVRFEHQVDSETRYTLKLLLVSERDIEIQ